jgi:spermidine synthase
MNTAPVIALLLFNAILLLGATFVFDKAHRQKDAVSLSLLFFCSGMPALIYQIVWQRALFAMYGVNAQSVAVVVTAFMLGLGLGSLVGGRLSARFPLHGILIFGLAELGVAVFGLFSLSLFHWMAARTAGADLSAVILFSLLLLLIPTILMGATLPLLVEHLVWRTSRVGASVATLYFVNTFGSAVACYLCASFLLRDYGQSGAVNFAAILNALVGGSAYVYARRPGQKAQPLSSEAENPAKPGSHALPLGLAMLLAGLSGLIALGFEILWFRVFVLASSDRAPAFALLLSTYLSGIAAGSFVSEKWTEKRDAATVLRVIGVLLLLAGATSVYLPPLVASLMTRRIAFLFSAPAFFVVAAAVGSVLPLLCQLAIAPDRAAGRGVSFVYVSNILGSAAGSLGIGFVLMQYAGLRQVSLGLGLTAVVLGAGVLLFSKGKPAMPPVWAVGAIAAALIAVPASSGLYTLLFERLIFGNRPEASAPFVNMVENRNGVIGVTPGGAVFSGGVYDGFFNVDPLTDVNIVERIYALSAFCASPKRMLVIGLASGSWAQILVNHPQVESMDAVEINPGYLKLMPQYGAVRTLLLNPKFHVYLDDGRRWLLAHPETRYDVIVANMSFHWRDHSSALFSVEFLELIRKHLNPGGIYYFNTTESDDTIATALKVFPHGLRVINFLVASDAPITIDKRRWLDILRRYRIDGRVMFDPANPAAEKILSNYVAFADSINLPPALVGMETSDSLRARLGRRLIITDDNMGLEWRGGVSIPWH